VTRPQRIAVPAPWAWAAWGAVLGGLGGVLLFAPAQWLAAGVASASQGHVLLNGARGSVWTGSAQLVLTGGQGSTDAVALPGRLAWKLRPRWDGAWVQLQSDCCIRQPAQVRARLRWGGAEVDLSDSVSQWPAGMLAGLGTPWNTLQLDGALQLSTRGLSVEWAEGRPAVTGRAELVAQRVSSRLSTLRPMGSYRITVQGGATTQLRVETLEGSLQLSGSGQWVGARLRFTGEAAAAPEREAALSNLLNLLGRRRGPRSLITFN
jgi:general secretion pathway protein N